KVIPEDVKQVANEERVTTAKLGDSIGKDNADTLIANIKEDIAKNGVPKTTKEVEEKVDQAASELNLYLTQAQKDQ
ncbi:DUF1002 domain-containing protein, partial [Bacillus pumilus]